MLRPLIFHISLMFSAHHHHHHHLLFSLNGNSHKHHVAFAPRPSYSTARKILVMASDTRERRPSGEPIRPFSDVPAHAESAQYPPQNDAGDNTFFYGCILQRDSSQYKTLKRVECVCHLVRSRIKLADFSGSHLLVQVLPCFRGNFVLSRPTKFFSFFAHQDERE